jgi:phosphoglycerate dehydrogenase-like enzyme
MAQAPLARQTGGSVARAILLTDVCEARWRDGLGAAAPGRPRVVLRGGALEGSLDDVEIAYFSGDCLPDRAREFMVAALKSSNLRWLHSSSAGVDHEIFQRFLSRGVRLTTSSGAHAVPIAQTVVLYLLALSRDLRGWLDAQRARRWEPRPIHDLAGQRLGVAGLGPIGLEVARLGGALRMQVIGLRRRVRGDEPCETWELHRLHELLPSLDHLVLALPLAPETRHLLDADALARMKPGATLVNVGRGALVDEAALADALRAGRLGGAALDVFEVEPLPRESPLWDLPNVIVTPHSSGTSPGNDERSTALFLENLRAFEAGRPLLNEVAISLGRPPHAE